MERFSTVLIIVGHLYLKIITESWIDWDSKPGKRPGGFSINVYEVHPYILLNWTDDLNGLFALAHESMGAILNYQSRNVNFLNVQHSIFLTELYSQIMENEVKGICYRIIQIMYQ